jgi:hypothetical protein
MGKKSEKQKNEDKKAKESVDKLIRKKRDEKELALYGLANDICNLRANQAEAECYAATANAMGDDEKKVDMDGVVRDKQYYIEKHFQFKYAAKYSQISINRMMIERGITVDEINKFMKESE